MIQVYIGFAWIDVVHTFGFNSHSWISGRQLSRKKGTYKETRIYCKTLYKNVFALKLWFMMAAIWQGKHNKSDLKKLKIFFLTWFWYYRPQKNIWNRYCILNNLNGSSNQISLSHFQVEIGFTLQPTGKILIESLSKNFCTIVTIVRRLTLLLTW